MADAASLIVRVKTEGAEQSAKQLDTLTQSSTKADTAVTKTGAAAEKATPKMSGFGTKAQQAGYQIQDFVVQVQSGTSVFVAFGQQASQLAGSLGPGGAVLGAVIALSAAIGGVLYKALGDSTKSLEEIEKAAKELDRSFQIGKGGVLELSDSLVEMAQRSDAAYASAVKLLGLQAQQQLESTTTAIKDQSAAFFANSESSRIAISALSDLKSAGVDVGSALKDSANGAGEFNVSAARLGAAVGELASKYGVAEEKVLDVLNAQDAYNKAATPENAQKLADAQTNLAQAANKNKKEILDQAVETQKLAEAHATAAAQVDLATEAQNRNKAATNSNTERLKEQADQIIRNVQIGNMADKARIAAEAQADKEAFAKREGVTKDQIDAYNAARDEQARQDIQRVIDTENKKAEAEATAASKRAAAETRRAENLAAQQKKQAQTFLDTLARQNSDELAAIDEVERQKLAKLQEFQTQGAISAQQAEDAKTQIMVAAEDARQEELANRRRDAQQKQFEKEQILAEVASLNASELELVEIQEQQKASILQRYRDEGILSEEEYQGALVGIAAEANKRRRDAYASVLGQTTDDLKTALGEGNKLYKAFAVANAVMQTYQSATAAYQSAAAIPVVGFALAPVAAAAAVAAGLANVARIKSAREQGGLLSAGQMSTIAERGQPEVIMPASASRVRTAQQMKQIMGENAASSQPTTVQIVNQTTGRIDSATTERMDEATLRVIIRETVSGDLQDSNSPIAKSRRATRGQAGY